VYISSDDKMCVEDEMETPVASFKALIWEFSLRGEASRRSVELPKYKEQ
jgi:hypothetical protein